MYNRRGFLGLLVGTGLLAAPRRARAIGPTSLFRWAQVQYAGRWNPRESGPTRLLWEVEKRTSVECQPKLLPVKLDDAATLSTTPFLCIAGADALPPFSDAEVRALRTHLARGGILYIESTDPREGSPFDRSVRTLMERTLPGEPLRIAPSEHVLYKSFYLLGQPPGRTLFKPYVEIVERDDRAIVVYSQNDVMGAWCRDGTGAFEYDVVPGGSQQREMAFRFGVNLVLYALCGNYKRDQVHVQYLLKRRRN